MRVIIVSSIIGTFIAFTPEIAECWQHYGNRHSLSPLRFSTRHITSLSSATETDLSTTSTTTSSSSTTPPPYTPSLPAYASGYATLFSEQPHLTLTSPTLPPDLIGTYYKSFPAMFSAGSLPPPRNTPVQPKTPPVPDGTDMNRMVRHPYDADGALLGLTFHGGNGTVTSRVRYIRTNAFTNERKFGKRLYNSLDNTRGDNKEGGNDFPIPSFKHHLLPGLNKKRKNNSNNRPIYWGKKLLTLWEGGLPYKLDALALSTDGRSQLGGILKANDPIGGQARIDAKRNRMILYGVQRQEEKESDLRIYEFNEAFRLEQKYEVSVPGFLMVGDVGVTEDYVVVVQGKVEVKGWGFMTSKEPGKSLTLRHDGDALLHLVKRNPTNPQLKTIPIPHDGYSDIDLKICNSYQVDSQTLVLDVIRSALPPTSPPPSLPYPWAKSLSEYAATTTKKTLWRYTVNLSGGGIVKRTLLDNRHVTFPTIDTRRSSLKHSVIYATVGASGDDNTSSPPQGITKITLSDDDTAKEETWYPPTNAEFCGEPLFAPRQQSSGDEDDGYLISILYDGNVKSSAVLIFDARKISEGPVARIPLNVTIPHGHYGCYVNGNEEGGEGSWTSEEIERRARLADKMESRGSMWNEVKSDFSGLGLRLDDFEEYFGDIM